MKSISINISFKRLFLIFFIVIIINLFLNTNAFSLPTGTFAECSSIPLMGTFSTDSCCSVTSISYSIDGNNWIIVNSYTASYIGNWTHSSLVGISATNHSISAKIQDSCGNYSIASSSFFVNSHVPPIQDEISPIHSVLYCLNVPLYGTFSIDSCCTNPTIQYSLDGNSWLNVSSISVGLTGYWTNNQLTPANGGHTILVKIDDSCSSSATNGTAITFTVDSVNSGHTISVDGIRTDWNFPLEQLGNGGIAASKYAFFTWDSNNLYFMMYDNNFQGNQNSFQIYVDTDPGGVGAQYDYDHDSGGNARGFPAGFTPNYFYSTWHDGSIGKGDLTSYNGTYWNALGNMNAFYTGNNFVGYSSNYTSELSIPLANLGLTLGRTIRILITLVDKNNDWIFGVWPPPCLGNHVDYEDNAYGFSAYYEFTLTCTRTPNISSPLMDEISPVNNTFYCVNVPLYGSFYSDACCPNRTIEYSLDNANWNSVTSIGSGVNSYWTNTPITPTNGVHTITVRLDDNCTGSAIIGSAITFTIDTGLPLLQDEISPINNTLYCQVLPLSGSFSKSTCCVDKTIQYTIDGSAWANVSSYSSGNSGYWTNLNLTPSSGGHTIQIRIDDSCSGSWINGSPLSFTIGPLILPSMN